MIIASAQRLASRDVEVEVHWVTGHVGVELNEQADRTAKGTAECTGAKRCTERFASLAHINRTLTERRWKEGKHWFKAKHDAILQVQRPR